MVLLLILVFGDTDLPLVAAVWAMMAFGDPAAAIAGRLVGGPALPWNRGQDVGRPARGLGRGRVDLGRRVLVRHRAQPPRPDAVAGPDARRRHLRVSRVRALGPGRQHRRRAADGARPCTAWARAARRRWIAAASVRRPRASRSAVNVGGRRSSWGRCASSASPGPSAGAVAGFLILAAGGWGAYGLLWTFFLAGTLATKLGYRRKAGRGPGAGRRGTARRGPRRRELPRAGGAAAARRAHDRARRGLRRGAGRHARHRGRHALRPARVLAARLSRAAARNAGRGLLAGHGGEPRRGLRSWPRRDGGSVWSRPRSSCAAALGGFVGALAESVVERLRAAHRVLASTTSSPTR